VFACEHRHHRDGRFMATTAVHRRWNARCSWVPVGRVGPRCKGTTRRDAHAKDDGERVAAKGTKAVGAAG